MAWLMIGVLYLLRIFGYRMSRRKRVAPVSRAVRASVGHQQNAA